MKGSNDCRLLTLSKIYKSRALSSTQNPPDRNTMTDLVEYLEKLM
ncbi:hypothetical protein NHE_0166 [Neorickettsia helminthoeca str. Oregon]|uniref:Uncharacterized protein n=1 Tax=Neorickettsia helminthoeca str. Oregon TaxID=1286528 RepID=X5H3J9_9RICK|nr:hypothetical protein NHE_0166 [Neorickettsia helminthoeca str. Oregon]